MIPKPEHRLISNSTFPRYKLKSLRNKETLSSNITTINKINNLQNNNTTQSNKKLLLSNIAKIHLTKNLQNNNITGLQNSKVPYNTTPFSNIKRIHETNNPENNKVQSNITRFSNIQIINPNNKVNTLQNNSSTGLQNYNSKLLHPDFHPNK